jgi:hypothetical protein
MKSKKVSTGAKNVDFRGSATVTRDRCYDFLNKDFAETFGEKIGVFLLKLKVILHKN